MSTEKSVQKSPRKRQEPRTELKSGELEFKLTSVLNRSKVSRSFAERLDAIKETAKVDLTQSELSEREKMIAGAVGFKGYEMPEWQLFLKTLDKKPKLNIELAKFIFERALNSGNDHHLLYFGCLAPKSSQQLVTQLMKGRKNWSAIEIILKAFSDNSISKAEQSKIHKSLVFLSSIIEQQNKSQFICRLVEIASKIDEQSFAVPTSSKKRAILSDIAKILLDDGFDSAFADAFSARKSDDETVRRLIKNFNEHLVEAKQLVDFVHQLLKIGRSKAVLNKTTFSKFRIEIIASLAASQEVRSFLLNEKDSYKTQMQALLKQGGVGALMQLIDQKKHFDLIVDPELVNFHFSSKLSPSNKVVELLGQEIIRKSEKAVIEVAEKRSAEVIKKRDEVLETLKQSEKKCAELQLKIEGLENQLRMGKKEQIVGKDRVTQQAQLQVLIEFSKFVEDLRVLSVGFFAEDETVRSVFRNAEKQLRTFNVAVVGEVGKQVPIGEDCFKSSSNDKSDQKIVRSPAYIFRGVDHEVVLVWGELKTAT